MAQQRMVLEQPEGQHTVATCLQFQVGQSQRRLIDAHHLIDLGHDGRDIRLDDLGRAVDGQTGTRQPRFWVIVGQISGSDIKWAGATVRLHGSQRSSRRSRRPGTVRGVVAET